MIHTQATTETPERIRSIVWGLVGLVCLDMVGFGMVVSDIQFRLESMRLQGWMIGAVLASMFLVQFPASTIWGRVADRVGGRSVLIACTLLSSLSMVVYGLSHDPWMVLASRVLAGLGAANVATAYAIASVVADDDSRAGVVGKLSGATVFGLTLGAALGGLVFTKFGPTAVGLFAALASFAGLLFGVVAVPALPRQQRAEGGAAISKEAYAQPLIALLFVAATGWLSLATLEGTFGRLIHRTLGLGQREFGLIFGFESLVSFVIQTFFFAWAAKRVPTSRLLVGSFLVLGWGLAAMPFMPSIGLLLISAGTYAAGSGLATPALNELIADHSEEARRGEVYGLVQSLRSIGFIVGPVVGGAMFDLHPAAPYLLASIICTGVAAFASKALRAS